MFAGLLRLARSWFLDGPFSSLATEVQVANLRMISILERMGFGFRGGKHPHTKHAVLPKEALSGSRFLKHLPGVPVHTDVMPLANPRP